MIKSLIRQSEEEKGSRKIHDKAEMREVAIFQEINTETLESILKMKIAEDKLTLLYFQAYQ